MEKKKKAASTTANLLNNRSKDTGSSRIIQQVRAIFLSGRKVTAKEINTETDSNDARRVISTLRNNEGWDIKDMRLEDGKKLYWLEPDKRQMSIDWEGCSNEDAEPYFKTAAELIEDVRKMVYDNQNKAEK